RRAGARSPSCRSTPALRDDLLERHVAADSLDVPFVPEREREQPPELPRQVLAAPDVVVEHARHSCGLEDTLPAYGRRRQRLAGERLELTPQPGGGGDREAALAPVH